MVTRYASVDSRPCTKKKKQERKKKVNFFHKIVRNLIKNVNDFINRFFYFLDNRVSGPAYAHLD